MTHSIQDIIIDGIVSHLTEELYNKPEDLKITLIRGGRLQDDPTALAGLNILVHYDNEGGYLMRDTTHEHFTAPAYYIGGGVTFEQTYRIEMMFHFKEQKRDLARRKAGILLSRVRSALLALPLPRHPVTGQPKDDFGDVLIHKQLHHYEYKEGGGIGQFIWTGNFHIQFFIETSPVKY